MKASLRIVLLVVLTLGASSWLEAALSRQNNVLGRFTVVSVTGTATCVSDGRILELKKGDTIRARGATLETAPGSKVSILFSNQTSTVLDEKTRFEIVKFDQEFSPRTTISASSRPTPPPSSSWRPGAWC